MREINRPLFIVGSARSGSTILYCLLAVHPQLCWVSRLTDRFPCAPMLSFAHRLLNVPIAGGVLKRRIVRRRGAWWLAPSEGKRIFEEHVRLRNDKHSTEADYDPGAHARMNAVISGHLTGSGKRRFVCKRPANTQRIRLLNRMYPDALFLHLIRDGRAVADSLTRVRWWDEVDIWWLGYRPPQWRASGRDNIELAALHWRHDTEEALSLAPLLGERYSELRYEDLVRDPRGALRSICDYVGYSFSPEYAALVPRSLPDMNHKWPQALSTDQQRLVSETIGDLLESLGYVP